MSQFVDLVPQCKIRIGANTTAAVVAGSTDGECLAAPFDRHTAFGGLCLSDQGDHELSPLPRAERGISSSRLKTFLGIIYVSNNGD